MFLHDKYNRFPSSEGKSHPFRRCQIATQINILIFLSWRRLAKRHPSTDIRLIQTHCLSSNVYCK